MRTLGRLFSEFRSLIHLIAYFSLIGLLFTLPAAAQGTRPSAPEKFGGAAVTKAPPPPSLKSEKGLVFKERSFRIMTIGHKVYTIGPNALFYGLDGRPIKAMNVRPGDVVDVQYLTGGAKTELRPYYPNQRVLVSLRVVGKGKR